MDESLRSARDALISGAREKSADVATFTSGLLKALNDPENSHADLLLENDRTRENVTKKAVMVLAGANIPAQTLHGVMLIPQTKAKLRSCCESTMVSGGCISIRTPAKPDYLRTF